MRFVTAMVVAGGLALSAVSAAAQSTGAQAKGAAKMMSPAVAHTKAMSGEVVLVDIRTPEEWKETGLPASAHAVTMNQTAAGFIAALDKLTGGDKSKPIALICRTGNRSSGLQGELAKYGYTAVIDVAEGMAGGRHGPGWLKAGLPIKRPD